MTAVLSATDALRHTGMFTSHDDQLDYSSTSVDWRAKYVEVADILAETRTELDEFHHSSKELEEELERELERAEKLQQDLKVKAARAEQERDEWKAKFMTLQTTHNNTTTSLQRELDILRQEQQKTKIKLRDLEMGNDDLERNERAVSSSLADAESKYSRALEEKILMEHELIDKANLEEECQRLKDELRDANEEIGILKDQAASAAASAAPSRASDAPTDISSSSARSSEPNHNRKASRMLSDMGPPRDLQLSDLSPSRKKPLPPSPSKGLMRAPADLGSKSVLGQSALGQSALGQSTLLRRTGLQSSSRPSSSGSNGSSPASLMRSTTAPVGRLNRTPAAIPRANFANRTNMTPQGKNSTPAPVAKSKGVQMVTEMRARVKNLEQKIHTRVPRLRMGSVTGGRPAAVPTPPPPVPSLNRASIASQRSASSSSRNSSFEDPHSIKRQSADVNAENRQSAAAGDTSGWVLIMEDSPSPAKVREKAGRDIRRSESPSERAASFRPITSSSTLKAGLSSLGQSTNVRPGKLSASGMKRSQSTSARLTVNTERSASASTTASTMSIPTPSSRPSTPTFLPMPSAGLYSGVSSSGNGALKRSTAPSAFLPKRSSLGGSTTSPTGIRPPSATGFYANFLDGLTDDDDRERERAAQSTGTVRASDPSLGKSRIGRLNESVGRKPALADLGASVDGRVRLRTTSTTARARSGR